MQETGYDSNEPVSDSDGKTFHTQAFDGPLDLLLFLIQKSEVNIYDIPIADITDQFLAYLGQADVLQLGDLTSFYRMAADLLYIKSRMLLPVDVEFDEEYEDPRQELVERLLEYQKFRKYTELLTSTGGDGELFVHRKQSQFMLPFGDEELFAGVSLQDMLATYSHLMMGITPNKVFNVYESVTVNEKITLMNELFETRESITLEAIILHPDEPLHVACSFMAILESCKFQMILIRQDRPFGTIFITRRPSDFDATLADEYDDDYDRMADRNPDDIPDADDFSIVSDTKGTTTADDGRIFRYDEGNEDECIVFDADDDE